MRRDEWARLAAPFPAPALAWCVVKLDPTAGTALLEPVVAEAAVTERLDATVGPQGWSKRYRPLGADAVACELELLGVSKSAVASSFGGVVDMLRVSGWACGRAAALFGLRPPAAEAAWVDFDTETGEPLYLPEQPGGTADASAPATANAATPAVEPSAVEPSAVEPAEAEPTAGDARSGADASGSDAEARSEGQQVIERLVERLKDEGLGRQAASLVVEFGGYGRTPEEARELYRRLRELLLEKGAAP